MAMITITWHGISTQKIIFTTIFSAITLGATYWFVKRQIDKEMNPS